MTSPGIAKGLVGRLGHALPSRDAFAGLLGTQRHGADVTLIRATVIGQRVYVCALLCLFLTLFWGAVDLVALDRHLWQPLALGRGVAAAGFLLMACRRWHDRGLGVALGGVAAILALSLGLFTYCLWVLALTSGADPASPFVIAYLYMPFVVTVALAVFPLTAAECLLIGGTALLIFGAAMAPIGALGSRLLGAGEVTTLIWLQLQMTFISAVVSISQLHSLVGFTVQSTRDALTGLFSRGFGTEMLQIQLSAARRSGAPFSLLFLDLDHFKEVNDRYGHDAGDEVLRTAARRIGGVLRGQDMAIRWGGEEFLVLLPNTGSAGAATVIGRLAASGLGERPEGTLQTASIGVAERRTDRLDAAAALLELVDDRMYAAKAAGRNRVMGPDGTARPFIPGAATAAPLTRAS